MGRTSLDRTHDAVQGAVHGAVQGAVHGAVRKPLDHPRASHLVRIDVG
jgi:hypothetical protein